MNAYTFHITPYDLAFLGTIFIGLAFSLMLIIVKRAGAAANRLLGLISVIIVLHITWALGINIRLETYFPHWRLVPLQFSLALGPLIYFYVIKITKPEYKFRVSDLLHLSPLLVETGTWLLEVRESTKTGAATYHTLIFHQLNPILQLLAFISVCTYLYLSHCVIEGFYRSLKFNGGDKYRLTLRWLHNFLRAFALLWLLWASFTIIDYLHYNNQSSLYFCPLYLLLAAFIIRMAAIVILRPEISLPADAPFLKLPPPVEFRHKGIWLKNVVKFNYYYRDPELSLTSLAEKLDLSPHELSRIVNQHSKKVLAT